MCNYPLNMLTYPGHGGVWRMADALSLAEYSGLADYAAEYGIELAPIKLFWSC